MNNILKVIHSDGVHNRELLTFACPRKASAANKAAEKRGSR
jgi:hypothetical protein